MVEPRMPLARKRDFSLSGAAKAWISGGVAVLGMEVLVLVLQYGLSIDIFRSLPPYLALVAIPLVQGIISFGTTWLKKNRPTA